MDFLLDSGAFSAKNSGAQLDLEKYIDFCLTYKHLLSQVVALDVMPSDTLSADDASQQSYINTWKMRDAGLDVMPVYHYGEPISYLQNYAREGFPWIGLGGLVGVKVTRLRDFLRTTLPLIYGANKDTKVHVFGVTSCRALWGHRVASVDSTSWKRPSYYGKVSVPRLLPNGQPNFKRFPIWVPVTTISGENCGPDHYLSMGPEEQASVRRWLETCGTTLERCVEEKLDRMKTSIAYYNGTVAASNPASPPKLRFAVEWARDVNGLLTDLGQDSRLSSYALFSKGNVSNRQIQSYFSSGRIVPKRRRVRTVNRRTK